MIKTRNIRHLIAETGRRQMKRILMVGAVLFAFAHAAEAAEAEIKQCLCAGMEQDVVLKGGAQADCSNKKQAIKIGPTEQWAEAFGEALRYAAESEKSAKIILYCRQDSNDRNCRSETRRLEGMVSKYSLPIEIDSFSENEVIAKCGQLANREAREIGAARLIPIW